MSVRFAITEKDTYRPLCFNGVRVWECHTQLAAVLRANAAFLARQGFPEGPSFLAEPVYDKGSQCIDWYAEGDVFPVRVESLAKEERLEAFRRLETCGRAMNALLARMENDHGLATACEILRLALRFPDPSSLYAVNGRLLLMNWGLAPAAPTAEPVDILTYRAPSPEELRDPVPAPPPPPPPAPEPVPAPGEPAQKPFLIRFLPALLGVLLLLLLLLALLFGMDSCSGEKTPAPAPAAPKSEPQPEPAENEYRQGDILRIPEEAVKKNDLSFLAGHWRSVTSLVDNQGNPITAEFVFDEKGRGTRTVHTERGRCTGNAYARFSNEALVIEAGWAQCSYGTRFVPQVVSCTATDKGSYCKGRDDPTGPDDSYTHWEGHFERR